LGEVFFVCKVRQHEITTIIALNATFGPSENFTVASVRKARVSISPVLLPRGGGEPPGTNSFALFRVGFTKGGKVTGAAAIAAISLRSPSQ